MICALVLTLGVEGGEVVEGLVERLVVVVVVIFSELDVLLVCLEHSPSVAPPPLALRPSLPNPCTLNRLLIVCFRSFRGLLFLSDLCPILASLLFILKVSFPPASGRSYFRESLFAFVFVLP